MGARSPRRVIIVEDDVDFCETLRRALSREGYQVHLAVDGPEALSLMRKTSFDLAIIDLVLPGMGGMRILEELQGLGLTIPTIVITAYGDRRSYRRALELGATAFLAKPIMLEEVNRVVRNVLGGAGEQP
jgi:DNA-binding response OmpR family regulator